MSRYAQQILVEEIGYQGQELLTDAKVLIIGAGGLGVPLATYLAGAGIGHITIADGDIIAETNLHRQFLYSNNDIGKNKAEVLKTRLETINPRININAYSAFIDVKNIDSLVETHDIICDCSDNTDARLLSDEISHKYRKPLVYAAVKDWQGYLTVLNYLNKIRLTDIFSKEQLIEHAADNCSFSGIVNTTCGTLASLQGTEVIKIILKQPIKLDGEILCIDTLKGKFVSLKLHK